MLPCSHKGKLPRLHREFYRGYAVVFWTLTLEQRAQGWLNVSFHARFRELMLHAAARSHLHATSSGRWLRPALRALHLTFAIMPAAGARRHEILLNSTFLPLTLLRDPNAIFRVS
jgi:hypothetical protein